MILHYDDSLPLECTTDVCNALWGLQQVVEDHPILQQEVPFTAAFSDTSVVEFHCCVDMGLN